MGSDQEATCEKDCKFLFDDIKDEMERVKTLLDLDSWACEFGAEALDDLVNKLASENTHYNDTYKLAKCFISHINSGDNADGKNANDDGADDDSDCYAFYMALIEELGIDLDTIKDQGVKDKSYDITLPMKDGLFTVSVKPFAPYVAEPWRSEIAKKANEKKVRGKRDDGMRVDPRWHYFVSWAKYWDVILNSNSEYAAKLRERDPEHAKRETPTHFSNAVMKKWLRKS